MGTSTERLTMVARKALLSEARSRRPRTRKAANESRSSATAPRTPFWRSRFENSISLSSTAPGAPSMQEVLVGLAGLVRFTGCGLGLRLQLGDHVAKLVLRLANVAFVLEDRRQRLLDEHVVEALHVQQQEGASPVERLADRRSLLQVELADGLDGVDDL